MIKHNFRLILKSHYNTTLQGVINILQNISISYSRKKIAQSYKNNEFKISAPTWNDECE